MPDPQAMGWIDFFRIVAMSRTAPGDLPLAQAAQMGDDEIDLCALQLSMLTLPRGRPNGFTVEAREWRQEMKEDMG